ncbi:MAG: ATP-binding protein [Anaerolineae bacterium]
MKGLRAIRIRTRLLIVYTGILIIGFAAVAVIAGEQISSAAQVDYSTRLQNEVRLIAQGIAHTVYEYTTAHTLDDDALNAAFSQYASQINGTLRLYALGMPQNPFSSNGGSASNQTPSGDGNNNPPQRDGDDAIHGVLELEAAVRGQAIVVQRRTDDGEERFYTAAPVMYDDQFLGLIQLSVPTQGLQALIAERWAELGLIFAGVAAASVAAGVWLARSIIQPLEKLRESALHLSKGNFSHRIAYAGTDEIGEVSHAFNEMAQQVESMLEEQRAFASNTSHELRTPLTTIRLRTEALRDDPTLEPDTARQYIEEIDSEVVRLSNLIQDLTLLSRFDAGRAELGQDQVDLPRFAASMQHQMQRQAAEKQITLSIQVPDQPIPIAASLTHLTVVFRNLIDNAIKYTPAGGSVIWEMSSAEGWVTNVIRDNGRGIDAAHLPRVFERFYRVDKARSRDIPGTGLGLSLVESIVRAYGGRISITSEGVDRGTSVTVMLPKKPEEQNTKNHGSE